MRQGEHSMKRIQKEASGEVSPRLLNYSAGCRGFSWAEAERQLDGLPGDRGLNIAHEAVDRHAAGPLRGKTALRWLAKDGSRRDVTYEELAGLSSRFANVLRVLGVGSGDRVYSLLGRTPDLFVTALGALKNRSVFCPLYSAFGPEPVRARLEIGEGKVLVTTSQLYRRKVAPIRELLPHLKHVLLVDGSGEERAGGVSSLRSLLQGASSRFEIEPTAPEETALLHFTSGTTGRPKGAIHVHRAVVAHHITGQMALDLHPEDVFWCTADPGWVTGTSYGIISPLTNGVTLVVDEAEFDGERWYRTLERERVTVWYTAPTAVRMLMRMGEGPANRFSLDRLRFVASVGEPLNPEAVVWSTRVWGKPIHDNWWQTETGGIMIANFRSMDIRPGSMGRPLPGIEAAIVRREKDSVVPIVEAHQEGELALRPGWPSMFRGYLNDDERYRSCFGGGYYLTGDLARRDEDGYFWFVGRADDVIKSAGHLIGPFEVESTLLEHEAVAEAAAIGKPEPVVGDIVKAFVSLKPGYVASDALLADLLGFSRKRLGSAVAPKEIAFLETLPRTRSGKIMRRLLRAREAGLPEGDLSTLEGTR